MTTFRELHYAKEPLVLPNAWDVGSALAFVTEGFAAVGTTSFGIAAAAGRPDGDRASKNATKALVHQLSGLPVLLTADLEDGYADDAAEVAEFVAELAQLGISGINMEDSRLGHLVAPEIMAAKIDSVKRLSPGVFINARVDNLWFSEEATVEAVLGRARTYAAAGADGIFVPGITDPGHIARLTAGIDLPVNVLAHPTLTVPELGGLGVRRVSSGSLPYRCSVDAAVRAVADLRDGRTTPGATDYWSMQSRLAEYRMKPFQ